MTLQELNKTCFRGNLGNLAKKIMKFLVKHYAEEDTLIYVNGYRVSYAGRDWHADHEKFDWNKIVVEENMDPKRYFEYAGKYLSMSFEGPFYDILNYDWEFGSCEKIEKEFSELLNKFGFYYELGNAWNLTLAKL